LVSVENAITGTPRARAARATGPTVSANSGPRMISAPSSSACWAACCAPAALPASSFTSSWRSGLLNSASAISVASRMDWAATAALPLADKGRIRPALTLPSPIGVVVGCDGAAGVDRRSERLPEQPASKRMDASAANHGERRAGCEPQACGPPNMGSGLLVADRDCDASPRRQSGIFSVNG
jgi:hypothetical protein